MLIVPPYAIRLLNVASLQIIVFAQDWITMNVIPPVEVVGSLATEMIKRATDEERVRVYLAIENCCFILVHDCYRPGRKGKKHKRQRRRKRRGCLLKRSTSRCVRIHSASSSSAKNLRLDSAPSLTRQRCPH